MQILCVYGANKKLVVRRTTILHGGESVLTLFQTLVCLLINFFNEYCNIRRIVGAAVALADEHGLHGSRATAFYVLNQIYRVPRDTPPPMAKIGITHVGIRCLSPSLLRKFIHGREYVRALGFDIFRYDFSQATSYHTSSPDCRQSIKWWFNQRHAMATTMNMRYSTDPIGLLDDMEQILGQKPSGVVKDICESCRKHLRSGLRETRQYLWDRLPEFFEDNSIYEMEPLLTTFPEALRTVSRYSASDVTMNVDLPYFRYFLPFPATASSKQETMVDYVLIDEIKAEA